MERTRHQATRERLLEAAAQQFAARGFKRVTIRDVCRAAHANVAAVNYHFRNKQGLYREVLELAIGVMRDVTESSRQQGGDRPPEDRLRIYVRIFLDRLLAGGAGAWLHRLMMREQADPTPAFDAIVDRGVRPRLEYVSGIVAAMTGLAASDERVARAVASIHAQCIMALPNRVSARLRPDFTWTPEEIGKLARHVTDFSLAGIRAVAPGVVDWGSADLDDDTFVEQFESGVYPSPMFWHGDHVRLAWIYVRRAGLEQAEAKMVEGIRRFTASVNKPEKYHDTMTRAWLRLVASARATTPQLDNFAQVRQAHAWLFDRRALAAFYSDGVLGSPAARRAWMPPDLHPLPA